MHNEKLWVFDEQAMDLRASAKTLNQHINVVL